MSRAKRKFVGDESKDILVLGRGERHNVCQETSDVMSFFLGKDEVNFNYSVNLRPATVFLEEEKRSKGFGV